MPSMTLNHTFLRQETNVAEHKAVTEEVLPMDCIYRECEHGGDDCPPV